MTEDKIQHTDALRLCSELTQLQSAISALQHELVLHYSATGVPSHKTSGGVHRVEHSMEHVQDQLDIIKTELNELDR